MTFIRTKIIDGKEYYFLQASKRHGQTVKSQHVEYLGIRVLKVSKGFMDAIDSQRKPNETDEELLVRLIPSMSEEE